MAEYIIRINLLLEQAQEIEFKYMLTSFFYKNKINPSNNEKYNPHLTIFYGLLNRPISDNEKACINQEIKKIKWQKQYPIKVVQTQYNTVNAKIIDRSIFREAHFNIVRFLTKNISDNMKCKCPPYYFNSLKHYTPHITIGPSSTPQQCEELFTHVQKNLSIRNLIFSGFEITTEILNSEGEFNAQFN